MKFTMIKIGLHFIYFVQIYKSKKIIEIEKSTM